MKRILIFSTAYLPMVGGAELAIKEITDRIEDTEFDLICGRFKAALPSRERMGKVAVYRVGIGVPLIDKLLLPFAGAALALRLDQARPYTCFWAMMVTFGSGAAFIANLLHFWRPVPIVLTLQEGDSERWLRYRWGGLIALSWWLALKRTSVLTVISAYLGNRARSYGYRGPVELVPNGVDAGRFSAPVPPEALAAAKKKLGKKEGDVFLVTTSRLVHKNAVDDVLEALPLLPPNVHFIIFGAGPDGAKLKRLTHELGVEERARFLGEVGHAELPKYLKACDIFVRPSRSEGMGNSFIEAMAAGIPVIATQEGGIADFLFDAKRDPGKRSTGFAVDKDSPEQIAGTVKHVLANPEEVRATVENARKLALEKYDWGLIARSMKEKIFDALL